MSDKQEMPKVAQNDTVFGNSAAMREALKLCGSRMCRLCKELELARSMLNKRPLGVFCHPDKCTAYQAAHAALALPPRNCDVPHKDDHELWLRWQAYCAKIYPSRMSFSTWLLDLAQEGGAK